VKVLAWLLKMTMAACFFTAVSLYATFTAVQVYVSKVLDHYQLGGQMEKIEFSDFMAEIGNGLNIMKQPNPLDESAAKGEGDGSQAVTGRNGSSGTGVESGSLAPETGTSGSTGTGAETEASEMPDAMAVWSQQSSTGQTQQGQSTGEMAEKKMIVSLENLQSTKDKISAEDKMKLFSLLVSKLPSEDVQSMSQLMEDGITQEELVRMDTIIQSHLTKEEYNQVLDILGKY
jgi:hypothetical protein